jgi:hypothetical protein
MSFGTSGYDNNGYSPLGSKPRYDGNSDNLNMNSSASNMSNNTNNMNNSGGGFGENSAYDGGNSGHRERRESIADKVIDGAANFAKKKW